MKKAKQMLTKKVMAVLMTLMMTLSVLPATAVKAAGDGSFGSAGVTLEAGTYLVPLRLMNANNLEQDSNAAACPGRYGKLTVKEDGSATLNVNLRSVTQGTLTDWAYNFKIYQKGKSGETKDAKINDTKKVQTLDNGSVAAGDLGKEKEVPTNIEFDIPDAQKAADGVYVSMYVDAMGYAPDAFLKIDYANAKSPSDPSLNYTTEVKSAQVDQFGKYTVNAKVTVKEGQISDVVLEGDGFNGTHASDNEAYLAKAINGTSKIAGMKSKLIGLYDTDNSVLNNLDAVSGATYSSNAIKEAVMNALGIEIEREDIPDALEEVPAEGIYTIDMKDTTEVVAHSLVGKEGKNEKQTAILTVDKNGKMQLTYKFVNSTTAEPLQVLGFNGYYTNNDKTNGKLSMDGVTYKRDRNDDSGLNVVTDVTIPLQGDKPQQFYYTNNYLYVDAMKNLGAKQPETLSGVTFDKGKFNINSKITLYWDTLEKFTKDELVESGMEIPFLEDGTYVIDGKMEKPNGDVSMSNNSITHKLKLTVKDGKYKLTMNFKGMKVGSLYGYLKNLSVYNEGYTTDIQNNPQSNKSAVKVESVQKYKDGSVVKDSLGTNYPDIVSFDLIPEALEDGTVPMQVFVPVMEAITKGTGTQNVYLKLDWNSVKATTDNDKVFSSEDVVETKPTTTAKKNNTTTKPAIRVNQKFTVGGNTYAVTRVKNATVRLVKAANKKSVTVPATVTIKGVKASVTEIGSSAFSSAKKKVKTVTIGTNVTTIGSKAFNGCKYLKTINVKTTKLKKVGSKALSGIHKKAVIKVPKKNKKAYTKLFKGKGQKKTVKVK